MLEVELEAQVMPCFDACGQDLLFNTQLGVWIQDRISYSQYSH